MSSAPPRFVDAAMSAGLNFVHQNGQTPLKRLPETMSGGIGLLDYDGDGWLDIYAVQGGVFPPGKETKSSDRLFRNRRDGTFEDVSGAYRNHADIRRIRTRGGRGRLRQRRSAGSLRHALAAYALLCTIAGTASSKT